MKISPIWLNLNWGKGFIGLARLGGCRAGCRGGYKEHRPQCPKRP